LGSALLWHLETLTREQIEALRLLGPATADLGFHMAGGTAVALRLGHRLSEDYDFFTGNEIADPRALARDLGKSGLPLEIRDTARGTLHGSVSGVAVSLLEFRYPLLEDPDIGPEGCQIARLDDLAAMKLEACVARGARRDFVDIWALGTRHRPLEGLITAFQARFGITNIAHVLVALAYFDDAERQPMPKMLWDVEWKQMRSEIQLWVTDLAR
jgi:hypothetical protein